MNDSFKFINEEAMKKHDENLHQIIADHFYHRITLEEYFKELSEEKIRFEHDLKKEDV